MNDTIPYNRLVLSFFVFGIQPRFPNLNSSIPKQIERMKIIAYAIIEVNNVVAERLFATALSGYVPSASGRIYNPGWEVLIFREKER